MSDIIKIKRSDVTATPASLATGEIAYSEQSGNFFIGRIADGVPVKIGGKTDVDKLATIDANATDDQTGAEIKALYEAEANAFTDTKNTKLGTIEDSADVTDATNVDAAGAVMESDATTASMSFVVDEDDMTSDLDTKVPTQQSVKAYVDAEVASAVASEMTYKGSYDAATNTPDLDTTPVSIALGDMYTVTVAGDLYSTPIVVGDTIIANTASAGDGDWVIVAGDSVTDHNALTNIGTNTHAQIDTHIADATTHFTQAGISITESQVSDMGNYLESLTGQSINNLGDVDVGASPNTFDMMIYQGGTGKWEDMGSQTFFNSHGISAFFDVSNNTQAPANGTVLTYNSSTFLWEATAPTGGGGSSTFVGLTDTPADFAAAEGNFVKVNSGGTALIYQNGLDGGSF
ncbi:MAG: hypothetical protein DRR06_18325 [Gammaproteobacteria bacterium]|nr:MAG: hypothetical protein DRR06_18325 [Gammaproteobacteria bacterium]